MRLIDADELRAVRFHALPYTHIHALGAEPYSYELGWNDAIDAIIDNAPTVDAVEVVRCKECKWFYDCRKDGWGRCGEHDDYGRDSGWWQSTDFCSYGERREDGIT